MKFRHMQIPPPKLAQEFESLCLDLFRAVWSDEHAQLNGRSGQTQHGADIFGKPSGHSGYSGIQCKVKDRGAGAKLTLQEIVAEIAKAEHFTPTLSHLIFATTASRDVLIQQQVRQLSEARITVKKFSVSVVAWEDIIHYFDQYPDVAAKYYPSIAGGIPEASQQRSYDKPRTEVPDSTQNHMTSELSARLSYAVARLNEGTDKPRLSASHIAEAFGFSKLSTVTRLLDGKDEPSIQFLQSFSDRFGVTFGWLLHADDEPFYRAEPTVFGPMEASALITTTSPAEVIFVRSQSRCGECTLIFKYSEWNYHTLPYAWHVSAEVGGTGAAHLVELHSLILKLRDSNLIHCSGQVLAEREFERLINGDLFAGAALARHHRNGDWWYAFPDFEHDFPSAPNYKAWYGQSFLDAQAIVQRHLFRIPAPSRTTP